MVLENGVKFMVDLEGRVIYDKAGGAIYEEELKGRAYTNIMQ